MKMSPRLSWVMLLLRDVLIAPLVILMPRNRRKIIFGAWHGRLYSCNSKYLFEYMVKRGGFKCIWIGEEHLRKRVESVPGAIFVRKGSLLALYHCLTAGFYACNVRWEEDIIWLPRCRRTILLYLTHGYPDKKMGALQFNGDGSPDRTRRRVSVLRRSWRRFRNRLQELLYGQKSWSSASSAWGARMRVENLPKKIAYERLLKAGIPRADFAINNARNVSLISELKSKYARILNIPADKRWYIFVPTWRHEEKYLFSFFKSSRLQEYEKMLREQNAVLIEKQHNLTLAKMKVQGGDYGSIHIVSNEEALEIDMQELQMACERLITDYSGVYFDTVLMDRPVVHFTYDYDHFMNKDMGYCFELKEYGGGPFAYTEDELLNVLKMDDESMLSARSPRLKQELLAWETGHSCAAYYDLIEQLSSERHFFVE